MTQADPRRDARLPISVRVSLKLKTGEIELSTDSISRRGFGFAARTELDAGDFVDVLLFPTADDAIAARCECVHVGKNHSGFMIVECEDLAAWQAFVDENEQASNLWSLIGKFASTSGDDKEAARSALEKSRIGVLFKKIGGGETVEAAKEAEPRPTRFHMVGENGEAYRVAFEKHGGTLPENSELVSLPGFKVLAVKVASRVMREDVVIKRDAATAPMSVRVVELAKGGYAYVRGGTEGVPVGLVSLAAGELILVERDGAPVFPFFSNDDLERIACDTFKKEEVKRPLEPLPKAPVGVRLDPSFGLEALRKAQNASPRSTRRYDDYGDRVIDVFPQTWIQAVLADGREVMGPTLRDGDKLLVLILEGEGAPRIARLDNATSVRVLTLAVADEPAAT